MQETHSTSDVENEWSKRIGGKLVMSHGTSNSRCTAILFGSNLSYSIKDQILDKNGRYVIVLCEIQGNNFLLINSYLPNYEKEQVTLLKEILEIINNVECPIDTFIIWGGDFNFIFDIDLEASGGNPSLKLCSIETMESIMLECDLCDIWRLRNLSLKHFTWRGVAQGRSSRVNKFLHRRLDFFFVSDEMQPYVKNCDIIPAPSTDHSAITLQLQSFHEDRRGPSFWKLNNSLLEREDYITELKKRLNTFKLSLDDAGILSPQLKWELIKYEIRKFSIYFSKAIARNRRCIYQQLESEIRTIENMNGWEDNEDMITKHDKLLKTLEERSNYITEGIIIRSKATWYELGEKSNKYFLTLEKRNKAKTHIKKLIDKDNNDVTQSGEILKLIERHFSTVFESKSCKTEKECMDFLSSFSVPSVSAVDKEVCERKITDQECYDVLKQMSGSKTPGNDGLSK